MTLLPVRSSSLPVAGWEAANSIAQGKGKVGTAVSAAFLTPQARRQWKNAILVTLPNGSIGAGSPPTFLRTAIVITLLTITVQEE